MPNGKVIMTSGDICKQGACTFDGLIVTRKFAKENPEFMVALVKAIAKADADYKANPASWSRDSDKAKAIAKWSGGKVEEVADTMKLYGFPRLQASRRPDVARRRRERSRCEGAHAAGQFPEGAGRLHPSRRTIRSPSPPSG